MIQRATFTWPFVLHKNPLCYCNPKQVFLPGSKGRYNSTQACTFFSSNPYRDPPSPLQPGSKASFLRVGQRCDRRRDVKLCLVMMQSVRSFFFFALLLSRWFGRRITYMWNNDPIPLLCDNFITKKSNFSWIFKGTPLQRVWIFCYLCQTDIAISNKYYITISNM